MRNPKSLKNLIPHRIKKGEVKNPKGRRPGGAYLREYMNSLAAREYTREQLKRIEASEKEPELRRQAASHILLGRKTATLADFDAVVQGTKDLSAMEAEGYDTRCVKKIKPVVVGAGADAKSIGNEIELADVSMEHAEFFANQTAGLPKQDINATVNLPASITFDFT